MLGDEARRRHYDHLTMWPERRRRVFVAEDSISRSSTGADILEEPFRELGALGVSLDSAGRQRTLGLSPALRPPLSKVEARLWLEAIPMGVTAL